MFVLIAVLFVNACLAGTIPATPENITVTFLTPTAVRVSWQTQIDLKAHPIEKYIVTYKPTDDSYRVVQDVAGSSEAIVLDRLLPSTQYSLVVTAIWQGKKYRSRGQIKFKTLDLPKNTSQQDFPPGIYGNGSNGARNGTNNASIFGDDVTSTATNTLTHGTTRELPTIRGVEIGIVLIVLMVWAGAIALFFNRWGKIRMLLPYQPDYKHEQLKVPGTGVCSASGCNGQHSHQYNHYFLFNPCTTLTNPQSID
ncbi:GM15926 [Drosophila sechellia]|uniref:GM15926 n=1 Tax=Drosophila sechellia TaxID=7238 RepID=B4I866_DROSE|nr:GM15926 [Drosophila sechellia]